jgi:hypothetical protein
MRPITFKIPTGDSILIDNGCSGDGACRNLVTDYVRINGGCNAGAFNFIWDFDTNTLNYLLLSTSFHLQEYSCRNFDSGHVVIGQDSCGANEACSRVWARRLA